MKNLVTAHEIRTPAKLGFFGQWIHFRIEIVGRGWTYMLQHSMEELALAGVHPN